MKIKSKFKGVFTSRDQACFQYDNQTIDTPINTAIVRWDINLNKIIFYQNLTKSIITVYIPLYKNNQQYFMLCSYQGEIKIIKSNCNDNKYQRLQVLSKQFNLNKNKLTFGSISNDGQYIIACCEQSLQPYGSLNIIKVNNKDDKFDLELIKVIDQNIYFAYILQTNPIKIWILDQPNSKDHTQTNMKIIEYNQDNNDYIILSESNINNLISYIYYLSFNNKYCQYSDDIVVLYSYQSDVFIINCKINTIINFIEKPMIKKCFIKFIIFKDNNKLLIGADSGQLIEWQKQDNVYIKTNEYICPNEPIYYMDYYQNDNTKIILNTISQFSKFSLVQDKSLFKFDTEFELNTLTNSACAISNCGLFSLSADFSGNILIWDNQETNNDKFIYKQCLFTMIRSVLLLRISYTKYEILVGTLEGTLYQIKLDYKPEHHKLIQTSIQIILQLKGGIITMDYSHKKIFTHSKIQTMKYNQSDLDNSIINQLANSYIEQIYQDIQYKDILNYQSIEKRSYKKIVIGTSEGYLCLLEQSINGYITLLVKQAHNPVVDYYDQRFGSLSKYAEIWSVCFSPRNQYIATCSEDQTARIWNLKGEQIHNFVGHSTAVTSIDWQYCEVNKKEIFITCGDDQKAIIWTLNEIDNRFKRKWILNKLFETNTKGLDWHTLTYLKLLPYKNGQVYAVLTTENGYIFISNIFTQEIVYQEKVHFGSIEGLDILWSEGQIIFCTVSSDCTVGIFNIYQINLWKIQIKKYNKKLNLYVK